MWVDGVVTNLGLLRAALALPDFRSAAHSTSTLSRLADPEPRIEVLEPGAMTTVQDWPGRLGYWQVGVPPSGPMDEVSLREANLAVGNPEGAPALECGYNPSAPGVCNNRSQFFTYGGKNQWIKAAGWTQPPAQ